MITIKLYYTNGTVKMQQFTGNFEKALHQFLGRLFDIGSVQGTNLQRCIKVQKL